MKYKKPWAGWISLPAIALLALHCNRASGPEAPSAPAELSAEAVTSSQINLAWKDDSNDEEGFRIERSRDGENFFTQAVFSAHTTRYADIGVIADATYWYRVQAFNASGNSPYSRIVSATPLAFPTGLVAEAMTSLSQINISWKDNSRKEAGYLVERSHDGTSFAQVAAVPGNTENYTDTGLSETTQYWYRVQAFNDTGRSDYSNIAWASSSLMPPAGLTATPVTSFQINISWQDNSMAEAGYQIEWSVNGVNFTPLTVVPANTTTYTHGGLIEATKLWYRVRAYNASGYSEYSNTASETTLLTPPTGLSGTAVTTSQVALSWQDNSSKEAGYRIERSLDGSSFTQIASVSANIAGYTDTGVTGDATYWYRVQAFNLAADSVFSNVVSVTTLVPPTNLSASLASSSQINLSWRDNSAMEEGYKIERSLNGVNFTQIGTVAANITSYTDAGLSGSVVYYYRVRAYNASGNSSYSEIAIASTPPWAKTYGGVFTEFQASVQQTVQQTSDGSYIVEGWTDSFGAGATDAWVLKLNSLDGTVVWQKTYGGFSSDGANSIQQTDDGGYIVVGATASFGAGGFDLWALKLSGDGSIEWQKAYGRANNDQANFVQQTSDGGYIIAGYTLSFGPDGDAWALKLSRDGAVEWQKRYRSGGDDFPTSIHQTSDGGYIMAGYTNSFGGGDYDLWVMKLATDGSVVWQKAYGGTRLDYANGGCPTNDGGYIVVGSTWSVGNLSGDVWALKLSGDGTIEWQKAYGGDNRDDGTSIRQTSDGGYIVAGFTWAFGAGSGDVWALKLSGDGTMEWARAYGGAGLDEAWSVTQTTDGGYIMAGFTNSFGAGEYDLWVVGLSSDGGINFRPSSGAAMTITTPHVLDTFVTGLDTTAIDINTNVVPLDTTAVVTDTNATIVQQAP